MLDRFDHQVHVAEVVVAERGPDQRHALLHLLLGDAAFLGGVLVVLADHGDAAFQGCPFTSRIFTGIPALAAFMAMPPPMVPAPMMHGATSRLAVSLGRPGRPGHFALGEEDWRWAWTRAHQQSANVLALALHAGLERQSNGGLDRLMQWNGAL